LTPEQVALIYDTIGPGITPSQAMAQLDRAEQFVALAKQRLDTLLPE
jgi:hypothetical protein